MNEESFWAKNRHRLNVKGYRVQRSPQVVDVYAERIEQLERRIAALEARERATDED